MKRPIISALYYLAALYDGVFGILFLTIPWQLYAAFDVTPPNHWAYVQFPAALLLIFALMFLAVARDPRANRSLILYGMLLKISYSGTVFGYWLMQGVPPMWKPFAIADLAFLVLFAWSYQVLGGAAGKQAHA